MDEAFIRKMWNELFNQYRGVDAVAEYIEHKEGASDTIDHVIRVMDVRIEPMQDMVNVHYTLVVDGRVRYRTSYPLRWELYMKIVEEANQDGSNPWTMQTYRRSPRYPGEMEKVSGPGIREVTPDEVKRILFTQFDEMKEGRTKLYFMDAPLAK